MFLEPLLLALCSQCITLAGSYRMGSLALHWTHASSRAADPLIQLRFTTLAKAESLTCAGEDEEENLALTSCTPASQRKLSFFAHGEVKECNI